jgi:lipopolysaccharide/colanic/teichoic acid biosynthesis glycosyltransferase
LNIAKVFDECLGVCACGGSEQDAVGKEVVEVRHHKTVSDRGDFVADLVLTLPFNDRTRRVLDVIAAITSLLLLAPMLIIAAVAIKIHSSGPLLSRETLYGFQNGKIEVFKLRILTEGLDPNATWIGRWLNQTGVAELPRLINVLRGEMSIVGRQGVPRWSPSIQ